MRNAYDFVGVETDAAQRLAIVLVELAALLFEVAQQQLAMVLTIEPANDAAQIVREPGGVAAVFERVVADDAERIGVFAAAEHRQERMMNGRMRQGLVDQVADAGVEIVGGMAEWGEGCAAHDT